MSRVIHFEIHASDPQKLIAFYSGLFGWTFRKYEPMEYWGVDTGDEKSIGINGGLLPRRGAPPVDGQAVNSFMCTVEVAPIDDAIAKALSLGGKIAVPKMAIPGVGFVAYVKDPDGNILGMIQHDAKAGG